MRIRDKLFPEGTKTRNILRKMAVAVKALRPHNIAKAWKMMKKEGFSITMKKAYGVILGRTYTVDQNEIYQQWIKQNEPTKKEIEEDFDLGM